MPAVTLKHHGRPAAKLPPVTSPTIRLSDLRADKSAAKLPLATLDVSVNVPTEGRRTKTAVTLHVTAGQQVRSPRERG